MLKTKITVAIVLTIALIASCAGVLQPPPPVNPVCPPPEGQLSWICDQSAALGVSPETIADLLFDASALAIVADQVDREWLCLFTGSLGEWYARSKPISYVGILNEITRRMKLIDDPEKIMLLTSVLNRRLGAYTNTQIISTYDDYLLELWWTNYRRDMMCE